MLNLTLQQIFGTNAAQTATTLTIQKADFPTLTAAADNRAEQLLVALLLQAHQHFEGMLTDELGRTITDELGRAITYDNRGLYEKLNIWHWKRQFIDQSQLNTFIADVFIFPATEPQTVLTADSLNY